MLEFIDKYIEFFSWSVVLLAGISSFALLFSAIADVRKYIKDTKEKLKWM